MTKNEDIWNLNEIAKKNETDIYKEIDAEVERTINSLPVEGNIYLINESVIERNFFDFSYTKSFLNLGKKNF